jgi:hypothetical protein
VARGCRGGSRGRLPRRIPNGPQSRMFQNERPGVGLRPCTGERAPSLTRRGSNPRWLGSKRCTTRDVPNAPTGLFYWTQECRPSSRNGSDDPIHRGAQNPHLAASQPMTCTFRAPLTNPFDPKLEVRLVNDESVGLPGTNGSVTGLGGWRIVFIAPRTSPIESPD